MKFIRSSKTNKYFSDQTRKQIEIGLEIAELAKEDLRENDTNYKVITSLLNQVIAKRDSSWKSFYSEKMNEIKVSPKDFSIYELLEKERLAEENLYNGDVEKAIIIYQAIVDQKCNSDDEKGWYLQQMARAMYFNSKSESNRLQKSAFSKNRQLLKPREGVSYSKIEFIDNSRVNNIIKWIQQHGSYDDMIVSLNGILGDLTFGMPAEKFETALKELGIALGFLSERPDKEHKTGPDNLWCGTGNQYIIFECKSEVEDDRTEISKSEAGQMNTHCGWFRDTYGDVPVKRILIIPTRALSKLASFTHDVKIMRKGKLKLLKSNVSSFFKEFKKFSLNSIDDETLNRFLSTHNLQLNDILTEYSESYHKKK